MESKEPEVNVLFLDETGEQRVMTPAQRRAYFQAKDAAAKAKVAAEMASKAMKELGIMVPPLQGGSEDGAQLFEEQGRGIRIVNGKLSEQEVPAGTIHIVNSTGVSIGDNMSVACQSEGTGSVTVRTQSPMAAESTVTIPAASPLAGELSLASLTLDDESFTVIGESDDERGTSEEEKPASSADDQPTRSPPQSAEANGSVDVMEPQDMETSSPEPVKVKTKEKGGAEEEEDARDARVFNDRRFLNTKIRFMKTRMDLSKLLTVNEIRDYHRRQPSVSEETQIDTKKMRPRRMVQYPEDLEHPLRICICHGKPSFWKFCERENFTMEANALQYVWEKLQTDHDFDGKNPLWLRNIIVTGLNTFFLTNPELDCQAAEMYLRVLSRRFHTGNIVEAFASEESWVRQDLRQFFKDALKMCRGFPESVVKKCPPETRLGLLSVMALLEVCGHPVKRGAGYTEENSIAIFCRVAGACTQSYLKVLSGAGSLLQCDCGASCRVELEQVMSYMLTWMEKLYRRAIVPSSLTLCHMGLDRWLPLAESVMCSDLKYDNMSALLGSVKSMIETGVSYSLNVCELEDFSQLVDRRANGLGLIGVLENMHEVVKPGRVKSVGCIYLNLWDILAFRKLQRMGARSKHLKYAVLVPTLFMSRVHKGGIWTFFFRRDYGILSRLAGKDFDEHYQKLEKIVSSKMAVPAVTVMRCLEYIVYTHNIAVIFRDNLVSPWQKDGFSVPESLGPEMASDVWLPTHALVNREQSRCQFERGFNGTTIQRFSINLFSCVKEVVPTLETPLMASKDGLKFFDFDELSNLVVNTVEMAEAAMCQLGGFQSFGNVHCQEYGRPLHIDVTGLHSTFVALGYRYGDEMARELNHRVFELIYYMCLRASMRMCAKNMEPFKGFEMSKYAEGWLHWDEYPDRRTFIAIEHWNDLRKAIRKTGLRHSKFISLSLNDEAGELANVSPGCWPVRMNRDCRNKEFASMGWTSDSLHKEVRETRDKLAEDAKKCDNSNESAFRLLGPRPMSIPKVNLDLKQESFEVAVEVVNMKGGVKKRDLHALKKKNVEERIQLFQQRDEIMRRELLQMCIDRAPFVDHCQAVPYSVHNTSEDSYRSLEWFLMEAMHYKLKVGVATSVTKNSGIL